MGAFIRLVAIVTSVIVLLGFGFFAVDEMDKGSKTQQRALDRELSGSNAALDVVPVSPTPDEDANDVLLAPFANLIDSDSSWVQHGVPALLALLLYGVGLGFLANLLPKERTHAADWRAAES